MFLKSFVLFCGHQWQIFRIIPYRGSWLGLQCIQTATATQPTTHHEKLNVNTRKCAGKYTISVSKEFLALILKIKNLKKLELIVNSSTFIASAVNTIINIDNLHHLLT